MPRLLGLEVSVRTGDTRLRREGCGVVCVFVCVCVSDWEHVVGRTFAPAATAFWTSSRHWDRLWAMLAVEQSCPTACDRLSAKGDDL